MLKIKKTKPYQHNSSSVHIIICTIALICGIVPSLALLTYFTKPANAASLTLSGITTMQEMTPYICDNSTVGETNTLTDIRDESTYTVAKLSDSKCWMTQNLRIVDKEITPEDSDVTENFTIPASSDPWDDTGGVETNKVYYAGNAVNGAYYSWYVATVNSGTAELTGGNAPSSICPKGWKLPRTTEYETLKDLGTAKVGDWNTATDTGYWIGGAEEGSNGAAFFPAAGLVYTGTLSDVGTHGRYWSSTASDAAGAYRLGLEEDISPYIRSFFKYAGDSVRCIAEGWPSKDVNVVAVRVSPVISIDATSGMKEEVDPNKITTGTISATVSANTTYAVQLSTNKTSLTNSALGVDTEITSSNSIPASTNVQAKTNAWGILNQDNSTYSAITTNPTTYYNTEEYNEESQSTKHTFAIGVSISPTLPAGEYSTTVTITAVNN